MTNQGEEHFVTALHDLSRKRVDGAEAKNLLLDPDLHALSLAALAQARGPLVTEAAPFPLTVWTRGAKSTWGGGAFTGTIADFVRLLGERAKLVAAKRTGWVVEPTTITERCTVHKPKAPLQPPVGHRCNPCTTAVHALFLDCDGTGPWDTLLAALAHVGLAHVAYQSGGWTEATPKWRVVLPLTVSFDTSTEEKQATWKAFYHRARISFGSVAWLQGEGFDSATDTPCCPWFLTEKRVDTDPPRTIIWRPGFALDPIGLTLALPDVEEANEERDAHAVLARLDADDERIEEIVAALAAATEDVPKGRRAIYLALPGVLLDRGLAPDDVLEICEQVSARYPRSHPEAHADNIHCASTTVSKWESGGRVTRIGTLNDVAPLAAEALDRLLPDPFAAAIRELMDGLAPPPPAPSPPSAPAAVDAQPPQPPAVSHSTIAARSHSTIAARVRKLVRKKRNAEEAQSKIDSDLVENFMAAEILVPASDIEKLPKLATFSGEGGLHRVAWVLGHNIVDVAWDAILNARSTRGRAPFDAAQLARAGDTFKEAQEKQAAWIKKRDDDRQAEDARRREAAHRFYTGKAS